LFLLSLSVSTRLDLFLDTLVCPAIAALITFGLSFGFRRLSLPVNVILCLSVVIGVIGALAPLNVVLVVYLVVFSVAVVVGVVIILRVVCNGVLVVTRWQGLSPHR
jgi:hypothetical protein